MRKKEKDELVEHCERELKLAGLTKDNQNAPYDGKIAESVLKLIKVFSSENHSELSGAITIQLFKKLANRENLTPLTNNPNEWMDISNIVGKPMWQNIRNRNYFSKDGGKTFYNINSLNKNNIFTKIKKWIKSLFRINIL